MDSQNKRVLEILRERGQRGLDSFEGYDLYIPRLAARIYDLKKRGYKIKTKKLENHQVRYILEQGLIGKLLGLLR